MDDRRPASVRLATWNCFGAPQSLEDFLEGRPFWPERLAAPSVIEALSCFDIVCIQENFVGGVHERLEALRIAGGFSDLWHDPPGPDRDDKTLVGAGLVILSRFPVEARFLRLPRGVGADGFARKGAALAEVRLPGGRELFLVNTHLQADDGRVSPEECLSVRKAQIEVLADALAEHLARGVPTVLCGDLNVPCGTTEYEGVLSRRLGASLTDLTARAGLVTYDTEENDVARAFHEGGPERALIDYVWTSKRVSPERVALELVAPLGELSGCPSQYGGRAFASDHFGVGVTITIGGLGA